MLRIQRSHVAQQPTAVIVVDRPPAASPVVQLASGLSPVVQPPSAVMEPFRPSLAGPASRGRLGYAHGVHNTTGGLGAVASCSLKGCATVAVGPRRGPTVTVPSSPIDPEGVVLSPRRAHALPHGRPLQGRAVGWPRDPGAALRLPPATIEQAFSLQTQRPRRSCTRA